MSEDHMPFFLEGVNFIIKDACQFVTKHRLSLFKANSVLFQISLGFFLIPFKSHRFRRKNTNTARQNTPNKGILVSLGKRKSLEQRIKF